MSTKPDLLDFLNSKMRMSNYYQPLIIQVLLENDGRATAEQLAQQILLYNDEEMSRAREKLNVHPWHTLGKAHGIVRREGRGRNAVWILAAHYESHQVSTLLEICRGKIKDWCRKNPSSSATLRFQLIQEAEGRCQACGVISQVEDLHIDHIVPQSRARNGKVKTAGGSLIGVHSRENLQVLCATCNTGKREHGDYDFRPSPKRLQDAIERTLAYAEKHGYAIQFSPTSPRVTFAGISSHPNTKQVPEPSEPTLS